MADGRSIHSVLQLPRGSRPSAFQHFFLAALHSLLPIAMPPTFFFGLIYSQKESQIKEPPKKKTRTGYIKFLRRFVARPNFIFDAYLTISRRHNFHASFPRFPVSSYFCIYVCVSYFTLFNPISALPRDSLTYSVLQSDSSPSPLQKRIPLSRFHINHAFCIPGCASLRAVAPPHRQRHQRQRKNIYKRVYTSFAALLPAIACGGADLQRSSAIAH